MIKERERNKYKIKRYYTILLKRYYKFKAQYKE